MSDLRKKMLESMEEDRNRSGDLKKSGAIYETYFEVPEEISTWLAKAGEKNPAEYFVDYVPFPFDDNYPNEPWQAPWRKGSFPHSLICYVHKDIGEENIWMLCPKQSYLERCPICEYLEAKQKEIYKDENLEKEVRKLKARKVWDSLRTYRRQLAYIIVRDGGEEEDKGLRLWETPTTYMYEPLESIRTNSRNRDTLPYWHVEEGKTIRFTVRMEKTKEGDFAKFEGHQFEPRVDPQTKKKYVIEDDLIELAYKYPIQSLLKRFDYDEMSGIFHSGLKGADAQEKQEETEEAPRSRRRRAAAQEEAPPPEEVKQEPEEQPTRRRRRSSTQEEAPPANPCPYDLEFGKDCLSKVEFCEGEKCTDDIFAACEQRKKELEEEAAAAQSAEAGGGRRRRRTVH